ncbi:MAG: hypothetical protein H0U75_09685 [Legionella sp.]|nr:hypothetical protein [Legionella sp.]
MPEPTPSTMLKESEVAVKDLFEIKHSNEVQSLEGQSSTPQTLYLNSIPKTKEGINPYRKTKL